MSGVLLLTAACGDDDDQASSTGDKAEKLAGQTWSEDKLAKALLTVSDLPQGFASIGAAPDDDDDDSSYTNECTKVLNDDSRGESGSSVDERFAVNGDLPVVVHELESYASAADAAEGLTQGGEMPEGCETWTDTEPDGTTSTYTYQKTNPEKLGDATYGGVVTVETAEGKTTLTVLAFIVGNNLSAVSIASSEANEGQAVPELAALAHSKLVAAAK